MPFVREPYPLSPAQRRLWFLDQLRPGGSEYNTAIGFRLSGRLDRAALRTALDGLVDRHESLRSTVADRDGEGVLLVAAPFPMPLATRDATRDEVDGLLLDEVGRPFDLRAGPLVRALLVRVDPADHLLVVCLHHIVTDGWSMGVLTIELGRRYSAAVRGRTAILPPLSLPYAALPEWQRTQRSRTDLDAQVAYWAGQLAGVPPLELPTDRPRPAERTAAGAIHRFTIPAELTARITELGRSFGATLFMTLVAVTQLFLARYTGQRDIALGAVTSGRNRDELENLVGFFVNTVVLRSRVAGSATFADFLGSVRSTVLDALGNDDVPFDRLVELIQPERDASRSPLVQVMMVLQNTPAPPPEMSGLTATELDLPRVAALFDLTLEFRLRAGELRATIEYSTDLFDAATIGRMAAQLPVLLAGIAADPGRRCDRLPLLPAAERDLLRTAGNGAGTSRTPGCPHHRFAEVARWRPHSVAVTGDGTALTYRGLDTRANRLAHALIAGGVRPDAPVGLFLPRGADAIVAMLGILKAGGGYVPLDPAYPADRIALLVADSGVRVVVTHGALHARLPAGVLALDIDDRSLVTRPEHDPRVAVGPDNLAYVMYTSGSSGRPKGVLVVHGAVLRLCADPRIRAGIDDVVAQYGTLSFDASTFEIWSALLSGARLAIRSDVPTAAGLAADGVTTLWLTAGMFRELADADPDVFGGLRRVLAGGDVVSPHHCGRTLRRFPSLELTNGYGPTEGTVFTTCHRVRPGDTTGASVPIGRPIAGTRCQVLDADMNVTPVGVPGELYVGGAGLARGYLNHPGLTADRFVADPFGTGTRLYRTGDVVRWTADGVLEFLGRADDQVKVRGFRVEVGEVEAALARHPDIGSAVVVGREDIPGHKRLVGYAVPRGPSWDPAGVLAYLGATLPAYLVPGALVRLDRMPLTDNGKIDRAGLPRAESPVRGSAVAPRDDREEILARIWADVLGVDWVGVHDNFFDLGGDSILSIQVVSRARQHGLHLTSQQVFLRQTVAGLAAVTTPAGPPAGRDAGPVAGPVPLTPIQRWFVDTVTVRPEHFNQWLVLDLVPDVRIDALRAAVSALPRRHHALRLRFGRDADGAWWQDTTDGADIDDVFRCVEPAAFDRAVALAQEGFRLDTGPLFRAVFADLAGGPRLALIAHHLVVDGISWRILLDDLARAYHQTAAGDPVDIGPATTPFLDWSRRLHDHVAAGGFDGQLPYWTGAVSTAEPLPGGDPAPTRTITVRLPAEYTRPLLRDVPAVYRTQVNDVLLAALARVGAEWTGRDRVPFELEGHGREDLFEGVDLSRTVGWFTTLFPCVLAVPTGDWGAVIRSVKERLRAIPTRGLGYGALRHLGGHELADHRPLIRFNYLGRFEFTPDGLCRRAPTPIRLARADHVRGGSARIDVTASVTAGGELEFGWSYPPGAHDDATIAGLAGATLAALTGIVRHCAEPGAGGCTPSDFPLVTLAQADLDRLVGNGRDVDDVYPLTPMQAGMLFHGLSAPGVYFEQLCLTLTGVDDPAALELQWRRVVAANPALRTAVVMADLPEPVQVVHRTATLPITRHDWRDRPPAERDEALRALLADDRATPLDLARPPLMRLAIIRLPGSCVRLVWSFHHLVLDGWSVFQVLSDVVAGLRGGRRPPPRRPFRDHLAWLSERDGRAAEEYWGGVLAGLTVSTSLPYDHPPLAAHLGRATAAVPGALGTADSATLTRFARRNRLTVNAVVQGAWAMLLARHAGRSDVCFGAVVSGRPPDLPGVDAMIGMFINTVPVRVTVDPGVDPVDWLRRLQADQVEARRFGHVSLTALHRLTGLPAGANLFDSVVVFENYPIDRTVLTADGMHLERLTAVEITNYPLNLVAAGGVRHTDGLTYLIGYDPELFDRATVEALATEFRDLVAGLVGDVLPANRPVRTPARPASVVPPPGDQPYLAPRSETELTVARIWAEVLAVDRVGVNDNFFALGGDSILSIRVAAKLRTAFGATLPPRALFDNPTVGALAMMFEHPTIEAMARLVDRGTDGGPDAVRDFHL